MTLKQNLVVKKIIENHGNISKSMREVGYKSATAKNPKNLTNSKAWPALLEKYLADDKLLSKHDEALEAVKQIGAQILIDKNGETIKKENEGMIEVPDYPTRLKAVELGYRVKGKLREEEGINIENKILIVPSELMEKYDIKATSNPADSGEGQSRL